MLRNLAGMFHDTFCCAKILSSPKVADATRGKTENEKDLITIEQFIEENFCDSNIARHGQCVESEFYSKWECPQKEMDELIALLEVPKRIYIRIHSYELANEYVSFRTFSNGVWNIK